MRRLLPLLLLVGCATPVGKPAMYLGHGCDGREMTVRYTEYVSAVPTIDCARVAAALGVSGVDIAAMLLQMPLACAMQTAQGAAVVLPHDATVETRHHEYEHLTGRRHPVGVPFYIGSGCG